MAVRSSKPADIVNDIRRTFERTVDTLFRDINIHVAKRTPVRTGRARRGWLKTRVFNLGYSGAIVENTVPYIGLLDQGHSPQAPAGYVKRVIDDQINRRPRKL